MEIDYNHLSFNCVPSFFSFAVWVLQCRPAQPAQLVINDIITFLYATGKTIVIMVKRINGRNLCHFIDVVCYCTLWNRRCPHSHPQTANAKRNTLYCAFFNSKFEYQTIRWWNKKNVQSVERIFSELCSNFSFKWISLYRMRVYESFAFNCFFFLNWPHTHTHKTCNKAWLNSCSHCSHHTFYTICLLWNHNTNKSEIKQTNKQTTQLMEKETRTISITFSIDRWVLFTSLISIMLSS